MFLFLILLQVQYYCSSALLWSPATAKQVSYNGFASVVLVLEKDLFRLMKQSTALATVFRVTFSISFAVFSLKRWTTAAESGFSQPAWLQFSAISVTKDRQFSCINYATSPWTVLSSATESQWTVISYTVLGMQSDFAELPIPSITAEDWRHVLCKSCDINKLQQHAQY